MKEPRTGKTNPILESNPIPDSNSGSRSGYRQRYQAFQLMPILFVGKIAESQCRSYTNSEAVCRLPAPPSFNKWASQRIMFDSACLKIMLSNGCVNGLNESIGTMKNEIGFVPKAMRLWIFLSKQIQRKSDHEQKEKKFFHLLIPPTRCFPERTLLAERSQGLLE